LNPGGERRAHILKNDICRSCAPASTNINQKRTIDLGSGGVWPGKPFREVEVVLPSVKPGAHRNRAVVAEKLRRLDEPHVKPLNDLAREISETTGHPTPWFDPDGGGIHARALFLLETPGRQASREAGSGFISADNADPTAENFFRIRDEAGLPRDSLVAWNIVPWYLGDSARGVAATPADIREARPWLERLVRLLVPSLRVVVPMGDKARDAWMLLLATEPSIPLLPTLALPHPSRQVLNPHPDKRAVIRAGLERVAGIVG
jgi:uracil-DNA glycosylase